MRLNDLEPKFLKIESGKQYKYVDSIVGADGIMFLCPKCFGEKGGRKGTHMVICWGPEVPQTMEPRPGRWRMDGSCYDDLTLIAGSSSVLLLGGCRAHFFIRNGNIE